MVIFIVELILTSILWVFAIIGLRHYEFAHQDGNTFPMKLIVHLSFIACLILHFYCFNQERNVIVSKSPMVEEIKK